MATLLQSMEKCLLVVPEVQAIFRHLRHPAVVDKAHLLSRRVAVAAVDLEIYPAFSFNSLTLEISSVSNPVQ